MGRSQLSGSPGLSWGHALEVCRWLTWWPALAGFWGSLGPLPPFTQFSHSPVSWPRLVATVQEHQEPKSNAHMCSWLCLWYICYYSTGQIKLPGQHLSQVGSIIPKGMNIRRWKQDRAVNQFSITEDVNLKSFQICSPNLHFFYPSSYSPRPLQWDPNRFTRSPLGPPSIFPPHCNRVIFKCQIWSSLSPSLNPSVDFHCT